MRTDWHVAGCNGLSSAVGHRGHKNWDAGRTRRARGSPAARSRTAVDGHPINRNPHTSRLIPQERRVEGWVEQWQGCGRNQEKVEEHLSDIISKEQRRMKTREVPKKARWCSYDLCTTFRARPNLKFVRKWLLSRAHSLIVTRYSSPGRSASRNPGRGGFNPLFCLPIRGQEPSLDSPRDAEPQGGPSQLRVEVTVLRAHDVPRLKNVFGLKFFVTVASQGTEKKTPSVPAKRRTARWGEGIGTFILQPSTPLILCLYAERFARRDILIGSYEMIPVESRIANISVIDTPFVLVNGDGHAGPTVTLYLTVIVSPNTTSDPIVPIDPPILQSTKINDSPSEVAEEPSAAQDYTTTATSSATLSPPPDRRPSETSSTPIPPAADRRGVSPTRSALYDAERVMTTINLSNKWEGALERIKWVMDTLGPVAELHPIAKMAHGLLVAIPKTLLEQFQRDDNIGSLLAAMHDAFDFTNQEDRFKAIGRDSKQARILTLMLQHVCNCCDFIQSYAKDSRFCT
ncbi:hypothetical protein EDB87DRAFT_1579779 [Lactarius vividus]|nr:hypothetical protein EDB87DRAFT_1579779 [Lactarius vividus]